MTSPTCTRCPAPARWRDGDGRHFCAGHVPANGKPLARLPVTDILDRLDLVLNESELKTIGRIGGGGGIFMVPSDVVEEAAGEIRRLRAELDKSGSC